MCLNHKTHEKNQNGWFLLAWVCGDWSVWYLNELFVFRSTSSPLGATMCFTRCYQDILPCAKKFAVHCCIFFMSLQWTIQLLLLKATAESADHLQLCCAWRPKPEDQNHQPAAGLYPSQPTWLRRWPGVLRWDEFCCHTKGIFPGHGCCVQLQVSSNRIITKQTREKGKQTVN